MLTVGSISATASLLSPRCHSMMVRWFIEFSVSGSSAPSTRRRTELPILEASAPQPCHHSPGTYCWCCSLPSACRYRSWVPTGTLEEDRTRLRSRARGLVTQQSPTRCRRFDETGNARFTGIVTFEFSLVQAARRVNIPYTRTTTYSGSSLFMPATLNFRHKCVRRCQTAEVSDPTGVM